MMEFIVLEESEPVVKILGPFRGEEYRLVVDDCRVPYVQLYRENGSEYDWCLVVDGRFAADVNEDEIRRWGYAFANAMAICAGYTSHGPNSQSLNRHSQQVCEI